MTNLLKELKNRGISVSFCARLTSMSKRTLQDHLDVPSRMGEKEEKLLKLIIKNHDNLKKEIKKVIG